ncbi:hypothetical protein [Bosea sp. CS1GBMeth4]|uniref:hypothetical protein n=1 Tax=Bosea sp. CS1GBMeth4 TaxID=1892849 RepID=UPI001644417D|nr:hypothetical protein [Bosea sp. CS1GBMeth4]
MTTVFVLFHTHDLGEGETDDKLIGVYASLADAQHAQARTAALKGFRDAPEGFVIDPYEIGKDHWTEGYVTVRTRRPLQRRAPD